MKVLKERKLKEKYRISGDNSLRDPPVPIPNTEVKPQHADGTWLATARESRSSPDSILFGHSNFECPFSFAFVQLKPPHMCLRCVDTYEWEEL